MTVNVIVIEEFISDNGSGRHTHDSNAADNESVVSSDKRKSENVELVTGAEPMAKKNRPCFRSCTCIKH